MYHSTRGKELVNASEAIINGIASDGGLYIIDELPSINFNEEYLTYSYKDIARIIFKGFFDDFSLEEVNYVIDSAYNEYNFSTDEMVGFKIFDNYAYLELYKGPTLAFKDMALTALPFLMEVAKKKCGISKKITILTATSGDTGGAALSGFSKSKDIDIVVLYPNNGVSKFQERQMLSFNNAHAHAFALNGNFDDCQNLVKKIFNEHKEDERILLSSANSINIGRLTPQIVYYFYSYVKLVNEGKIKFNETINVSVPTGNFGNILALYYAKKMGLPINTLICSSNMNNVLTEFFGTGIYDSGREFYKTNSPSMDILISSNLERLLCINSSVEENIAYMKDLKETKKYKISDELRSKLNDFDAYYANEDEIVKEIINEYKENEYLIDPHTACAKIGYNKSKKDKYTLVVSTADPVKFQVGFEELNITPREIEYRESNKVVIDEEFLNNYLFNSSIEISVPASTANLGSGFDVVGLALQIYNTYRFTFGNVNKVIFQDKRYNEVESNLVYKSYAYVFSKLNKPIIPVIIEETSKDVPTSRGLGSSSCCIVAGVCAAGYILGINDKEQLLQYMIELEGHPDNVAPCYLGGLVASLDGRPIKYEVSDNLEFIIGIPNYELSTKDSRGVMPKDYNIKDVTYNLSRIIHLPYAFRSGDMSLIKNVLKDKLHVPYRTPLIKSLDKVMEYLEDKDYACTISGAGSSILVIGNDYDIINDLDEKFNDFCFVLVEVDKVGATIK